MKGFKLVSALVVLILTGCMTIKSYVDPTLPRATFADLRQNDNPQPVRLSVEFQTNGNLDPKATEELSKKTAGHSLFLSIPRMPHHHPILSISSTYPPTLPPQSATPGRW